MHCDGSDREVAGVFDSERKALDFVIKNEYSGPFYSKMGPTFLDDNARPYIEEMEVQ